MSMIQVGNCKTCGAPIYQESVWMGILPPPVTRTCSCNITSIPNVYIYEKSPQSQPTIKFPDFQIKTNPKFDIINKLKMYKEDVTSKAELAAFEAVIEWFIRCTPDYKE